MENPLISSRCAVETVPESYVLPPERRPGKLVFPLCNTIPVIDLQALAHDRNELIRQIIKASQEYGFFQMINHGVPAELMEDVLKVGKEFFDLPAEEKETFSSDGVPSYNACSLKSSINYAEETVHYWRDNLRHPSHPVQEHVQRWPKNPARYREVMGRYAVEVRRLSMELLDLIGEGLGLEPGYFEGELSQAQIMSVNHYPACPDPTMVLGLPRHNDPYLLTLLNQGNVLGLQIFKDQDWLAVEPIPNAFVVNINNMLQVISNGKLRSSDHRAVTNSSTARTTIVSFIRPSFEAEIGPEKSLINAQNPAVYKSFLYKDFMRVYFTLVREGDDSLKAFTVDA